VVNILVVKLFLIEIFFSFLVKKSQSLFIIVEPRFGTGVLPQKRAGELYHRFHVDPSHGSIENCVLNSSSFNRTEILILNIFFNYNYSSSSSPKLQRYLSRHIRPIQPQLPIYYSLLWHIQRFQKPILL